MILILVLFGGGCQALTPSAATRPVPPAPPAATLTQPPAADTRAPQAAPTASPTPLPPLSTATLTLAPAATRPLPTPPAGLAPLPNPGAPNVADYTISVRLDPARHHLSGQETLVYHNTSQQPIPDLMLHLYLNAFKSADTLFMQESGGQLRGDQFNPANNGWIDVTSLQVQGGPALKLELLQDGTLARAALPAPIQPGQSVAVALAFEAQLPQVFARTGWALDQQGDPFYLVGQWFPKAGVWTGQQWEALPFHGNAEFFADFGNYEVTITAPKNYIIGATGLPAEAPSPIASRQADERTVTYQASGVIDFAWVASPNLQSATRQVGKTEVLYLYLPEHAWSVQRTLQYADDALTNFGAWYGPYAYARLTVVDVPEKGQGAGGMEYPTFVTTGAVTQRDQSSVSHGWGDFLEVVTVHEIAHQWFQSMVATNEAEEPWLDEGFADYSLIRLMIQQSGLNQADLDQGSFQPGFLASRRRAYLGDPTVPMYGPAWKFTWNEYVVAAYAKPDLSLLTLQRELGDAKMTNLLHTYATRYRFAHPTTSDFRQVATSVSGQNLDWFFAGLVYSPATLNYVIQSIDPGAVTLAREGDLGIPVEILVTFQNGQQQTLTWDGTESPKTFPFPNRTVRSVDIDPQHKLLIELNWADNQRSR